MAFRRDVAYLDQCIPEYVDLNGEEFKRVVRLLEAVLPKLVEAPARVQWTGTAKDLYAARLREADGVGPAFHCGPAYARDQGAGGERTPIIGPCPEVVLPTRPSGGAGTTRGATSRGPGASV